jgi:hypothetical protein
VVSQGDREVLAMRGLDKVAVVPINPADLEIDPVQTTSVGATGALSGIIEALVRMALGHRLRT